MKKTLFSNGFVAIAMVVLLLSGCPLFDLFNTNTAPDADAGRDQTVQVDVEVTLDGHDSEDPDGDKLTYSWSFASRPPDSQLTDLDIIGLDQRTAYFTPDVAGIFDIDLTVDDTESSDTDTVRITVNEPAANSPPVADAGADKNVYVGDQVPLTDPIPTIRTARFNPGVGISAMIHRHRPASPLRTRTARSVPTRSF